MTYGEAFKMLSGGAAVARFGHEPEDRAKRQPVVAMRIVLDVDGRRLDFIALAQEQKTLAAACIQSSVDLDTPPEERWFLHTPEGDTIAWAESIGLARSFREHALAAAGREA